MSIYLAIKLALTVNQKYHMYTAPCIQLVIKDDKSCIFHWHATQFMNLILYFPELG